MIKECIIVSKEVGDKFILAKNRDRVYKPKLEIIHTIFGGIEVVYLHDLTTDWSEGMNEFGIGVVNSALLVVRDESEHKVVKKRGKTNLDGSKVRNILRQPKLIDAVRSALAYRGKIKLALKGHTFISSPKYMVSIETTSKHKPEVKLRNIESPIVRTNHGHVFTDAGYSYTDGERYLSSKLRKISAEMQVDGVDDWREIARAMRKEFFPSKPMLNMKRDTEKMFTSSQVVMNLTDRIFQFTYFTDKVEYFGGIKTKLPAGYEPKIKIEINKI